MHPNFGHGNIKLLLLAQCSDSAITLISGKCKFRAGLSPLESAAN